MSSSPTFIVSQTKGVEEEKLLAIDQGRSHTSSPRSRPNSRLEILIMDMARSQEERTRSQEQKLDRFARSTEEKLDGLARSAAGKLEELTRSYASATANMMGRRSSVERSLYTWHP